LSGLLSKHPVVLYSQRNDVFRHLTINHHLLGTFLPRNSVSRICLFLGLYYHFLGFGFLRLL